MSNFDFLLPEWPDIHDAAVKAEDTAHADPRTSAFYARRALELAVRWAYTADETLHVPYQDNLSALLHEPTFKQAAGEAVFNKARLIDTVGNRATQDSRPVTEQAAVAVVEELFHVCYWLARTYARGTQPDAGAEVRCDGVANRYVGVSAKHGHAAGARSRPSRSATRSSPSFFLIRMRSMTK